MAQTVRLTVKTGPHRGRRFCFRGAGNCLIGRDSDCFVRFFGYDRDSPISRRHCQLFVDPPAVRLQDLGSLNGTYINGHALAATQAAEDTRVLFEGDSPISNVTSGDIVTIGGTSFAVDVVDCPEIQDTAHDPVWEEGETAKKDCPIPCLADGSLPLAAYCVGGFDTSAAP